MAVRTVLTLRYMENVTSIISQRKYSMPNEKNSGDTSHQALTKYIFSEILITIITEFRRN